ncbi:MAG: hypothetical protein II818_01475 [Aeriscardovia sp.]|nr:hypothetical protein [Aeriscardovia sp.]
MKKREARHGDYSAKQWITFSSLIVIFSLICWGAWAGVEKISDSGRQITIGLQDMPTSLDMRTTWNPNAQRILLQNVYQGLLIRNDQNEVAPGLASGWNESDNGLLYTFQLRKTYFSDGQRVNAEDAILSIETLVKEKYPGYMDFAGVSSFTAPSPYTLQIHLSHPNPELLWYLAGPSSIIIEPNKYNYQGLPVGAGPYVFSSQGPQSITLTRNRYYWNKPYYSTVVFKYFSSSSGELSALKEGSIQGALDLSSSEGVPSSYNVSTGLSSKIVTLVFNDHPSSLMSDLKARQSMRLLIDKNQVIAASGGLGLTVGGPIPRLDPGYEDLTSQFPFNVEEGKSSIDYYYNKTFTLAYRNSLVKEAAESIKSQLAAVGINLQIYKLTPDQWTNDVVNSMKYDMVLYISGGSHTLGTWVSGQTWWGWDSPQADRIYHQSILSPNYGTYTQGMSQTAKLVAQGQPADWLYQMQLLGVWKKGISGAPQNLTDYCVPVFNLKG